MSGIAGGGKPDRQETGCTEQFPQAYVLWNTGEVYTVELGLNDPPGTGWLLAGSPGCGRLAMPWGRRRTIGGFSVPAQMPAPMWLDSEAETPGVSGLCSLRRP